MIQNINKNTKSDRITYHIYKIMSTLMQGWLMEAAKNSIWNYKFTSITHNEINILKN